MKRDDLEKMLNEIDNSVAVECMDNSAFYILAHELNNELNAKNIRVADLQEANNVLTKMRDRIRHMFDLLEGKVKGSEMSICDAKRWLLG